MKSYGYLRLSRYTAVFCGISYYTASIQLLSLSVCHSYHFCWKFLLEIITKSIIELRLYTVITVIAVYGYRGYYGYYGYRDNRIRLPR